MVEVNLLVINPNSSESITNGLKASLDLFTPPGARLSYFTAPPHAPKAINNTITAIQTAAFCYEALLESESLLKYDGFLVCCFSDHPLTHMLREHLASAQPSKPTIGIFEAAVAHAMLLGRRFGIVTTGHDMKNPLITATSAFLGASSERFAGVTTSGLGVVELREGDRAHVDALMKSTSAKAASLGADVLIMGCAGMAGMEDLVKAGVREAGLGEVQVVDGARAGIETLAGFSRITRA